MKFILGVICGILLSAWANYTPKPRYDEEEE